jgi:hypothetical protein
MSTTNWPKTNANCFPPQYHQSHSSLGAGVDVDSSSSSSTSSSANKLPTVKIESRDMYECSDTLSGKAQAAVGAVVQQAASTSSSSSSSSNTLNKNHTMHEYVSSDDETDYVYDNGDNKSTSTKEDMSTNRNQYNDEYNENEYYTDESENDRQHLNQQHQQTFQNKKLFDNSNTNNTSKHSNSSGFALNTNTGANEGVVANLSKNNVSCTKTPGLICVVCGASANGYNFDRITCESCKAFFRRNAFRPLVSRLGGGDKKNYCFYV